MKNVTKAVVVGGLMVLAQTALANDSVFPGAADDAGVHLPAHITFADRHGSDPVRSAASAFPGAVDDAGVHLRARSTYADSHGNDRVRSAASVFPGAADDAGVHLPARITYADSHLGSPVALSGSAQGAVTGAN